MQKDFEKRQKGCQLNFKVNRVSNESDSTSNLKLEYFNGAKHLHIL